MPDIKGLIGSALRGDLASLASLAEGLLDGTIQPGAPGDSGAASTPTNASFIAKANSAANGDFTEAVETFAGIIDGTIYAPGIPAAPSSTVQSHLNAVRLGSAPSMLTLMDGMLGLGLGRLSLTSKFADYNADFASYRYSNRGYQRAQAQLVQATTCKASLVENADGSLARTQDGAPRRGGKGLLLEATAGGNMFTYSNDYSTGTAAWAFTNTTAVGGQTDPCGSTSGWLVTENNSGALFRRNAALTVVAATTYTIRQIIRRSNTDIVRLMVGDSTGFTNSLRAYFNLNTGAALSATASGTGFGYVSHSIDALGSTGWYIATVTFTAPGTSAYYGIVTADADGSANRANVGSGAGIGSAFRIMDHCCYAGSTKLAIVTSRASAVTRAADDVRLILPAGTWDVTLTFDDNTTTVLSGISGTYQLSTGYGKYIKHARTSQTVPTFALPKFVVGDYYEGSGTFTDNTAGMNEMFEWAELNGGYTLKPDAGAYAVAGQVQCMRAGLRTVQVTGAAGHEIVFTNAAPASNYANIEVSTPDRSGGTTRISGLHVRMNRATVRTGGCDMIRSRGMAIYYIEGNWIESADNDGITVGRESGTNSYTCTAVYIRNNRIGGRREASGLHSHGSIGDSAIWCTTPGTITRITGNIIRETGDDGIFIGHNNKVVSAGQFDIEVSDNDLARTSGGIGTSMPYTNIRRNTITITLNCAIRFEEDTQVSSPVPYGDYGLAEANNISYCGHFDKLIDANATSDASQVNPWALWIRSDSVVTRSNVISMTLTSAYRVQGYSASSARTTQVAPVSEADVFDRVFYSRDGNTRGLNTTVGVFCRMTDCKAVLGFTVKGAVVTNTDTCILSWIQTNTVNGAATDTVVLDVTFAGGVRHGAAAIMHYDGGAASKATGTLTTRRKAGTGQGAHTTAVSRTGAATSAGDITYVDQGVVTIQ